MKHVKLKTVEELIDYLQQYSNDTKVRVCRKNGINLEVIAVSPIYLRKRDMIVFEISDWSANESTKDDE